MREVARKRRSKAAPPNPSGLCMCGCGQKTVLAKCSNAGNGNVIGEHVKYVVGHTNKGRRGPNASGWKGGRIMRRGYVMLYMPGHPRADIKGYIPEHQVVACEARGRDLEPGEVVHHVNGVKDDNRPENLEILTADEHRAAHRQDQSTIMRRFHQDNPDHARKAGIKGAAARWGKT